MKKRKVKARRTKARTGFAAAPQPARFPANRSRPPIPPDVLGLPLKDPEALLRGSPTRRGHEARRTLRTLRRDPSALKAPRRGSRACHKGLVVGLLLTGSPVVLR